MAVRPLVRKGKHRTTRRRPAGPGVMPGTTACVSWAEACRRRPGGHVLEWVATGAPLECEVLVDDESRAAHRELSCKWLLGEGTAEEAVAERDDALELGGWQDASGGGGIGGDSAAAVVDRPRLPDAVGQARERAHPLARLAPLVHRPHVAQEARAEELGAPERPGEVGGKAREVGRLLAAPGLGLGG